MRHVWIAAVLLTSASAAAKPAPSPADEVLALVNQHRAYAGLPAVTLDAQASAGCMAHAKYMLLNKDSQAMVGLNAHKEDMSLPGATPAGAACGKAADLFPGVSDLGTAVEGFMSGLYHRRPILSPDLQKIGVGYAALPDGTLMAAVMFVDAKTSAKTGWPVAYPGPNQADVPLAFGNEIPNPIPGGDKLGGYPITLQFPPFDGVSDVAVELRDATGKVVPIYLSTPEQPATSFGQYGVICAIPKALLAPNTTYTAKFAATWTRQYSEEKPQRVERTWKFTTVGLRKLEASDEAGLLAAAGKPSLVHGTVKHGGYMGGGSAFLQLEAGTPKRYEMVSVIIPVAVMKQLAVTDPAAWKGKVVDVQAAPQLVQNRYLNLPIVQSSQLRIAK